MKQLQKVLVAATIFLLILGGCSAQKEKMLEPSKVQEAPSPYQESEDIISNGSATDLEEKPTEELKTPVDPEQMYASVLDSYRTALSQGYDMGQLTDAGLNYLCAYYTDPNEIGYMFLDVDENGVDELLIGTCTYGEILDIYTIVAETPKLVLQGGERSSYYLCTDGSIANEGSNSAFESVTSYYTLADNGELRLSESIIFNSEKDELECFYSTSGISVENAAPISLEAAEQVSSKYVYMDMTFVPLLPPSSNELFEAPQEQISHSDIEAILSEYVPAYVAVAGPDVSVRFDEDGVGFVSIPLQSAIPDAFTVSGTINALICRMEDGHWLAETYTQDCEIIYNYADTYAEDKHEVRFCEISRDVTVGAGCAMIDIMPIDETVGGSDPTGDIHTAYLDRYTGGGLSGVEYILETPGSEIQVFMDAQMKPVSIRLPKDIWDIP